MRTAPINESQLDTVFNALGDATRRRMLRELAGGEHTVSELAEPFSMSLAAASKHIKVLENAGLIEREIEGRVHRCRLAAAPLKDAHAWLSAYESFWSARLDALEALLRKADRPTNSARSTHSTSANRRKKGN